MQKYSIKLINLPIFLQKCSLVNATMFEIALACINVMESRRNGIRTGKDSMIISLQIHYNECKKVVFFFNIIFKRLCVWIIRNLYLKYFKI